MIKLFAKKNSKTIVTKFMIWCFLLILFSSSLVYAITIQLPQEPQKEMQTEALLISTDISEINEQPVIQDFPEIVEIEEPQNQTETPLNIEPQTQVIINENNVIIQNITNTSEIEEPKNQTETPLNKEPQTSLEYIDIFDSAELWYQNFVDNHYNKPTNNMIENETLWGTNLGQPKDYSTYPFFSQPETRQHYIDANIKVIRIFNSASVFSNAEYVVDEIRSIGAIPIIVSGTDLLLEYVRKCGTKAIYQVGNEPNYNSDRYGTGGPDGYANFYKEIVDQCVEINPDAKFMPAAIGVWASLDNLKNYKENGLDYITKTIATGAKVDYVAFNYYTHNPDEVGLTKRKVLERANNYQEIVQIIGDATGKPVACTEWNLGQWTIPREWIMDTTFVDEWTSRANIGLNECVFSLQWFAQHWTVGYDSPMAMLDSYGNPKPLYNFLKDIA